MLVEQGGCGGVGVGFREESGEDRSGGLLGDGGGAEEEAQGGGGNGVGFGKEEGGREKEQVGVLKSGRKSAKAAVERQALQSQIQ